MLRHLLRAGDGGRLVEARNPDSDSPSVPARPLASRSVPSLPGPTLLPYGPAPEQFTELTFPVTEPTSDPPYPVVVLVHGGFWRARYDLAAIRQLVPRFVAQGFAVAAIEYRRVGQPGGGWPGTLADVAAAIDALAAESAAHDLALHRLAVLGHSAGGHLALWLAARHRLPATAPGGPPVVQPAFAVSLAGVCDLATAARQQMGDGAVRDVLGGMPDEVPDRYALADPIGLLPLGVPTLLVSGDRDASVTVEQSRSYRARALAAGDEVELLEVPKGDHFIVVDPGAPHWAFVDQRLAEALR